MNDKVIKVLKKLSTLLLLKGDNPFKARAYSNAAELIKTQEIDIEKAVKENTLASIKGFGKALQEKITDYVINGEMQYYKKLIAEIPPGLIEINKVSNIGPKKARMLFYNHNITSIELLEQAAKDGSLVKIKGFSSKTSEEILNSIQHLKASRGRFLMHLSQEESKSILDLLKSVSNVNNASLTDKNRRFAETIDELNFIVSTNNTGELLDRLKDILYPELNNDIIIGKTSSDIPVKIYVSSNEEYILMLHKSTGSKEYINEFNNLLYQHGYNIKNNKLLKNDEQVSLNSEKDLYDLIGIQYVVPELRERYEILTKARDRKIPELIKPEDMRGMIHVHSNWSDGINSIKEMALEAKDLGFSYIVICDHSQSASYAGGLTIEQIDQQHNEIDELNEDDLGIRILKGIESDILQDGSLDYSEEILSKFDLVVASVHSHFKMSEKEMTKRIVYALMSPYTTMLGHPTGRLLLAREAYPIDIDEVIKAAADFGKIIEINSNPYRFDLSWENAMKAKEMGVKISINPDSHNTSTLKEVFFGVKSARKAGLTKEDVVNCLEYDDFLKNIVNK
jgi:DNA polymerase (family 10)